MYFQAKVHLHISLCCLDGALISAIFSPIGFYSFDFLNFPFAPFQWDCVTWLPQLIISLHKGLFPTVGFITTSQHFLIISYLFLALFFTSCSNSRRRSSKWIKTCSLAQEAICSIRLRHQRFDPNDISFQFGLFKVVQIIIKAKGCLYLHHRIEGN